MIAAIVAGLRATGLTQRQLASKRKRSNSFVWQLSVSQRQFDVTEFIEIAGMLGIKASKLMPGIEEQ